MLKSLCEERLSLFGVRRFEQLLQRFGLRMSARGRILFWIFIAWVPLFVFSLFGRSNDIEITFFEDFPIHIRLILGVVFLVGLEGFVDGRMKHVIPIFIERGMINDDNAQQVLDIVAKVRRMVGSFFAEVLILFASISIVQSHELIDLPNQIVSWKTASTTSAMLAQFWYQWVSLVAYHFILFRWLWSYLIWIYFLFRMASLRLILQSHHPDQRGGLAFILLRHATFGISLAVVSIVLSANIAGLVKYGGRPLSEFYSALIVYFAIVALTYFAPLFVFTPLLIHSKRRGLRFYGRFASRHATDFEKRWEDTSMISGESPLGVQEISSNADLDTSYGHLCEMRVILITRQYFIAIACFAILPFLPLTLLRVPLFEILSTLTKVLM